MACPEKITYRELHQQIDEEIAYLQWLKTAFVGELNADVDMEEFKRKYSAFGPCPADSTLTSRRAKWNCD